jgi:carbon monoxide dehydrogenase subunit G
MASIRKEVRIDARPETAWAALRDVGALHTRLVPGFVTDTRLEDGARVVTFGNGTVVRELIVDIDDDARRLVWSAVGGSMTHHNGSAQVFPEGARGCRFVWIADLLPNEVAPVIAGMMEQGIGIIKETLERTEREQGARGATTP